MRVEITKSPSRPQMFFDTGLNVVLIDKVNNPDNRDERYHRITLEEVYDICQRIITTKHSANEILRIVQD